MNVITTSQFNKDAARFIGEAITLSIKERGECRIALSGGNTPKGVYEVVAGLDIPWEKVLFTFSDERCVPPEHSESNFAMAEKALFEKISAPQSHIFRLEGELPPTDAALRYEKKLEEAARGRGEEVYQHDLVLLGLGADGHTASLFPETSALKEKKKWIVANYVKKLKAERLTMTYPLINAARQIYFLVNDPAKENVLKAVLEGDMKYPASHVSPECATWIIGK